MPNVTPNRGNEISAARSRQLYEGVDRSVSITGTGSHTTRGFVPAREWWKRKEKRPSLFQSSCIESSITTANDDGYFSLSHSPAVPYISGLRYTHTEGDNSLIVKDAGLYDIRLCFLVSATGAGSVIFTVLVTLGATPDQPNIRANWGTSGLSTVALNTSSFLSMSAGATFKVAWSASLAGAAEITIWSMWLQIFGPFPYK